MIPLRLIEQAEERIRPHLPVTPLRYDPYLDVYLKLDNRQVTGSFKARGALNKILSLSREELARELVAASAGNHGQGVALAAGKAGAKAIIFASEQTVPAKSKSMRGLGAEVRLIAGGYGEAEQAALEYVRQSGGVWVSPYNDPLVIAGQGTLGLEVDRQLPPEISGPVLIPVGGGGLLSGAGSALKEKRPQLEIISVQPAASAFMHAMLSKGSMRDVPDLPTLADGLAGPLEEDSQTIPIAKQILDHFVLVDETEIAQAIAYAWYAYQEKIEGAAAVTLAAVLSGKVTQRPAILIFSGGNIQPEVHARLLEEYASEYGELGR